MRDSTCLCNTNLPRKYDISIYRGDTYAFTTRVTFDGDPGMLSPDSVVTLCAWDGGDGGDEPILRKQFSASDQDEHGYVNIVLLPGDTEALDAGTYEYEVEFRFSAELVVTPLCGLFTVRPDHIKPNGDGNDDD